MTYVIPPAGLSPAATWVQPLFVQPGRPPAILCDAIDVASGELLSIVKGVHPVDGAIAEQFRLREGTGAAVAAQGSRFSRIKKITEKTPRQIEDEARRIMRYFDGSALATTKTVQAVAGEPGRDDLGAVYVEYRNRQTDQRQDLKR